MGCQQANTQIAHTDQTGSIGPYGPRVETAGTMRHMAVSPRTAQGEGGSSHRAFPVCSVDLEISQDPQIQRAATTRFRQAGLVGATSWRLAMPACSHDSVVARG